MSEPGEFTMLLVAARQGSAEAELQLLPFIYEDLRRMAGALMQRERKDHTLQPTALVNEAYLRLVGGNHGTPEDRAHFFAIAANCMRQVLIDYARKRLRQKRGGEGLRKVEIDEAVMISEQKLDDILAIDAALNRLSTIDQRQGRIVELRYFCGMSVEEVAQVLGVSERTAKREWRLAKAWLHRACPKFSFIRRGMITPPNRNQTKRYDFV